ncbi:Segregation and condensation protein A [hydrothermal vent metagenome]|uniref:Segregation and condensation protein A n=1 Tax=hydrothermal vent metagenome TaxID=652676 RepID=A0A3B0U9P4_9ZZZZ
MSEELNLEVMETGSGPGFDDTLSGPLDDSLPEDGHAFIVDVDGYEGPLDLLLALARVQKVDLTGISILALAEQYLAFVAEARHLRLELAADYLVMAAWLAYLKSRLLLPQDEGEEEPSGEELAARLAFRLQRLAAMRNVGARLMARNLLGRDVFARGNPEGIRTIRTSDWQASLYDLLSAYAARRAVNAAAHVRFRRLAVWSIGEARSRLERLVGTMDDWTPLDSFLVEMLDDPELRASVLASSFSASLEMAREGKIEIRQAEHYDPIYMRKRDRSARVGEHLKSA